MVNLILFNLYSSIAKMLTKLYIFVKNLYFFVSQIKSDFLWENTDKKWYYYLKK